MTSGSFTIGGATPDYATIAAWDADVTGNLTGIVEGKCRAVTFSENVVIDAGSFTTTSSFYMKLTYDTGAYHAGAFGAGVVVDPAATLLGHVFQIDADYTRVVGLEVTDWQGQSSEAFRVNGDLCRFEQLLVHSAADVNADGVFQGTSGITIYISNCFFAFLGRSAVLVQGDKTGTIWCYLCTGVYCTGVDSDGYCVFGYDGGDGPQTSHTMHLKACYGHVYPSDATTSKTLAFRKVAAASWGDSTKNASSDASAPGTSPQTNAAVADQLMQALSIYRVGENTADDYSGSWEDSWMNTSAQTANYGGDVDFDIDNNDRNALFRVKLDLVPSATRVKSAFVHFEIKTLNAAQFHMFKVLRNWVEAEVTWLLWSTGNSWTTAGALSHNNDIYDDATYGGLSGQNGVRSCSLDGGALAAGDYWRTTGGALFLAYVQAAIDGSSGAPKGNDWIDIMFDWMAGSTAVGVFDSSEHTDGQRPYMELYYDTAAAPLDPKPAPGGVLDNNGLDLSGDTDYPISIDIQGLTRTIFDIGAWLSAQTFDDSFSEGGKGGETLGQDLTLDLSVADGGEGGDAITADRPQRIRALFDRLLGGWTWFNNNVNFWSDPFWEDSVANMTAVGTWPPTVAYDGGTSFDGTGGSGKITPQAQVYDEWADGRVAVDTAGAGVSLGAKLLHQFRIRGTNTQSCNVMVTGTFGMYEMTINFDGTWQLITFDLAAAGWSEATWENQMDWIYRLEYGGGGKPSHQLWGTFGLTIYFYLFSSADPIWIDNGETYRVETEAQINTGVPDDSIYIQSGPSPGADICRFQLQPAEMPVPTTGWRAKFRYRKSGDETIDLDLRLYSGHPDWAGAQLVKEWNQSNISGTVAEIDVELSGGEVALAKNPQNLWVEFEANVA